MSDADKDIIYKSVREKFLSLSLESTRKSYYPQLKKQLEVAKENERRLQLLIDNVPARISYVNAEERYVSVNREYEKSFGLKRDQIIGRRVETILGQDNYIKVKKHIHDALSGKHMHFETSFTGQKGEIQRLEISYVPDSNLQGNVIGFYALTIDITEKKRVEEEKSNLEDKLRQAQKMESIGTLAGGIAHDFNNILGIILGNAELAMDDVPEWNSAKYHLKEIKTACIRSKDVVLQLLSFARKTDLEKKPINIIPVVNESLKLLRSSIPTSIEIRQDIGKDVDTILANATQINQVLINLCTNADHAMPDGGIIEINLKNIELCENETTQYLDFKPGRYVHLTVSDTGHGIPKEEIDRIFEPYYTKKEIGKGTGLGLSVVHGIVKGHNGAITVDSEVGKGTVFNIFFPVIGEEAVEHIEAVKEIPTGNEKILVVDDEESIVNMLAIRLRRLGYQVEAKTNPVKALEVFRAKPDQFDLVITDMTMPHMTGDKLARAVKQIRSDAPVILCTGFNEKVERHKEDMEIEYFLMKPVDRAKLAITVRRVLDEKIDTNQK